MAKQKTIQVMPGNTEFVNKTNQFSVIKCNSHRINSPFEILPEIHRHCLNSVFHVTIPNDHNDIQSALDSAYYSVRHYCIYSRYSSK